MSGEAQAIDRVPQLVHDIVALIRLRPGALLRLPTSPCWGLALTRMGTALWIAISIAGCARIAARRRPWVHARAAPEGSRLASLLAAHFPHAEPREAPGTFLFALDGTAGPCGRAVILAQPSAERFPWMVAGAAQPLPTPDDVGPMAAAGWPEVGAGSPPGAHAADDLVSGGALPGPDDPLQFMAAVLASFDPSLLVSDDGRSRVRSALLVACAQERQRLAVLHRAWPAISGDNPYREPSWLTPATAELEIDRALSGIAAGGRADAVGSGDPEPPPAVAGAMAPPRRPLVVPPIRPAVALSAERTGSDPGRTGAG